MTMARNGSFGLLSTDRFNRIVLENGGEKSKNKEIIRNSENDSEKRKFTSQGSHNPLYVEGFLKENTDNFTDFENSSFITPNLSQIENSGKGEIRDKDIHSWTDYSKYRNFEGKNGLFNPGTMNWNFQNPKKVKTTKKENKQAVKTNKISPFPEFGPASTVNDGYGDYSYSLPKVFSSSKKPSQKKKEDKDSLSFLGKSNSKEGKTNETLRNGLKGEPITPPTAIGKTAGKIVQFEENFSEKKKEDIQVFCNSDDFANFQTPTKFHSEKSERIFSDE